MTPEFLRRLLEISKRMAEMTALDPLLEYTMQVAIELAGAQRGYLVLRDKEHQIRLYVKHDTIDPEDSPEEVSYSILQQVLESSLPLLVNDALSDPEFKDAESVKTYQLRSVMGIPLISRQRILGAIYIENRSKANLFDQDDLETLTFFANQTAVSIENAMLTADLQHSRERLVTAREEERRRLRRDLHDDLGPSLAAITLTLDGVANLLHRDPDTAYELVQEIKGQTQDVLHDVRRITYNLRPPAIDELGLIQAIREYISTCQHDHRLQITFSVEGHMPDLPAAVEVAIYRITLEALTNVIRHAQASLCDIVLRFGGERIKLTVKDNGQGIPEPVQKGVGLHSMQERATEIGGRAAIRSVKTGGTLVSIELPVPVHSQILNN